jgi:hypothetical protein
LRFHVKEAGADAKLTQHGPLGAAYHRRHPNIYRPSCKDYSTRHGARLLKFFSKEISDQKSNKIDYDNKPFIYWPTGPTNNSVYTRQRFIGTNLTIWKLTKSAANEDICAIQCSISFWKSEV